MAGERDDHDERITDALRDLAGDDRHLDPPPPELWGRIAGALDDTDEAGEALTPPPAELWDRIAAEVRDLGGEPDGPVDAPATTPATTLAPPRPQQMRRLPRRAVAALAAAAVLLLVGAVAVVGLGRGDGRPTTELVARASLSGKGLDPGGSSTGSARLVREDGAWEVAIRAADLPAPAPGTYYEAWLLGSGPDQVQSLGTLDGSGGFTVPDGLDVDQFPLVDVSVEPIDGNPAHSAKSVLRGRLEPA